MIGEFEKWLENEYPAYLRYGGSIKVIKAAFLAGAKAQQKRDVEVAMECARTAPKSIGWDHRIHHSAGCQRVASAIKRQEVE